MLKTVASVSTCWPLVQSRQIVLIIIVAIYALFCLGLGVKGNIPAFYSFELSYLHPTDANETLRLCLQEGFSLAWLAIWVSVGFSSLQRLSRFFSPSNQLWLRMRGVSVLEQTLTGAAWAVWISASAAILSYGVLLHACWRFGFPYSLAYEHSAALFAALLFAHAFCLLFFGTSRLLSGTRQQIILIALVLPVLLVIAVAAVFQHRFADYISMFPAAAPYLYAVPRLDFIRLALSTALWGAALLGLTTGAALIKTGFSNRKEVQS